MKNLMRYTEEALICVGIMSLGIAFILYIGWRW